LRDSPVDHQNHHLATKISLIPIYLPSFFQNTPPSNTLSLDPQVLLIFLCVVDIWLDEEDLKALGDAIVVSLSLIPPNALVGLITDRTMVLLLDFSQQSIYLLRNSPGLST
jgi:Sec23/Sec24 trunk domain